MPPPPPTELSVITLPIRTDLRGLTPEIERRVPRRDQGTARERGIDINWDIDRDPILLTMIGEGLHASTTVRYAMQACRGRFPCVSCGYREARREADITLQSALRWDPSWQLRSSTRLLPVHYPRPCEVTWFDIDITRRFVAPVVESRLEEAARIIDHNVAARASIRPWAERVWRGLQEPVAIAPRTWLVLEPRDVALGAISGSGSAATTTLELKALTRVVVGEKPPAARTPLPPLRVTAVDHPPAGMRVPFDLEVPYAEANRLASSQIAGRTFRIDGKLLTIETIRMSESSGGRLLVEATIDYRGGALRNYRGDVFLEGTPRFDASASRIVVPDLEYSLQSERRGFMARIAERAAHDGIRQRLRESAQIDLAPRLGAARDGLTKALTRSLAPGVQMEGRADALVPTAVYVRPDGLLLRAVATGRAEVGLRIED